MNGFVGCGSRDSATKRLSPDAAFEKLKPSASSPLICEWAGQYGCGFMSVSSVYLNKKIESSNFLVQCSSNERGFTVMFRDRIANGLGSGLVLQVQGASEFPSGSLKCGDLQTETVANQLQFKSGTCAVGFRFGETEAWSQNDAPCSISFEQRDGKNAGVIECPQLVNGVTTWTFDGPAVFKCP